MASVPYYLRPSDTDKPSDLIFEIPITITPPSIVYTEDQVKSIWTEGLEGVESVVDRVGDFATDTVKSSIEGLRSFKDSAVDFVTAPVEFVKTGFQWTMWLTIAGVLTIIYLVVK